MKKIFRFQYEPCVGSCYTRGPEFYSELKLAAKDKLQIIVDTIVKAHDSTCDDLDQRFGVDYDEENKIYVGSFINGRKLDLFSGQSFLDVALTLSNHVIVQNKDKEVITGGCNFGENGDENLAEIIMMAVAS